MLKIHFNKTKYLFLTFIIICCAGIGIAGRFLLPPADTPDTLQVLRLDEKATPSFYMAPQITYTPENWAQLSDASLSNLITHLGQDGKLDTDQVTQVSQELSLTKDSSAQGSSELSLTKGNLEQKSSELSLISTANLSIDLNNVDLNDPEIIKDLSKLSSTVTDFTLSVFPKKDSTDQDYIDAAFLLYKVLNDHDINNAKLILYPVSTSKPNLYDQDFITAIGTVLKKKEDLKTLNTLYDYFLSKKALVVRDEVADFYSDNATQAVLDINEIYYTLAANYPGLTTIYAPNVSLACSYVDSYWLDRTNKDFYMLYTVYSRLTEQSWITLTPMEVSNQSAYKLLESYDELTGNIKLVLSPSSTIIKAYKQALNAGDNFYLGFKWDTDTLDVPNYYPYSINLDTTKVPNGVSRLKVVLQDHNNNITKSESIDLTVKNPVTTTRAKRIDSSCTATKEPISPSQNYIPILMYHTVDDTFPAEEANSSVDTQTFDSQMKALLDNGYTPINFHDLKQYMAGEVTLPEKPILLTMDDGYLNNYTKAYPIYKKYNIQATLFVSPYYMQNENTNRHFGWKAAKEMEDSGLIDIQSHGYNHTPFPHLSLKDLKYQISHAQGLIEFNLGPRDVSIVACPQFRNTRYTRKVLSSLDVQFQITKLAKPGTVLNPPILKRINVPSSMTADDLISTLDQFNP